jgi:CheY-like chemotaxis protein
MNNVMPRKTPDRAHGPGRTYGPLDFLSGGGETGARLRELDWTSTPLGDPAGWPQSLKTIVRVMLDSRYAMWMLWGPGFTFFCNDAYLPTVGLKRDWVLGSRADKVWEEIWPDIGPRITHVLEEGQATWDEGLLLFLERSGFSEETYHTFSFDLFVQSERTLDRAQGGLGIGLSVVKKLLQMHGGEIQAHSAGVGKGSTFEIKLPRVAPPSASSGGAEMQKVSPRRVFIVDDNADAADSLAELLRIEGHKVQAVHSPAAALELIDSFHPDIALLDIGLPDMDGFELVRRLRERPALVGVKFVALTGYGQIEDRRRVRESGFDDHLIKPSARSDIPWHLSSSRDEFSEPRCRRRRLSPIAGSTPGRCEQGRRRVRIPLELPRTVPVCSIDRRGRSAASDTF